MEQVFAFTDKCDRTAQMCEEFFRGVTPAGVGEVLPGSQPQGFSGAGSSDSVPSGKREDRRNRAVARPGGTGGPSGTRAFKRVYL